MNNKTIKYLQKSVHLIEKGLFKEAEKFLNQILLNDAHQFDALYLKGILYGMQSKHIDCKNYLLRAEVINPNHGFLQYNLAKAMTELGEEKNALKHHERAVSLMPKNPNAWLNLGKCLFNLKLQENALETFDKAIEINPNFAEAYSNRGGVLYVFKRFEDALLNYEKAIELKPDLVEAYLYRGNIQAERKRLEDALLDYDKAIELKPEYAEAYFNRGNLQVESKRLEDALLDYDKAIELKPDYAEAYFNRGNLQVESKRLDDALSDYDKAIELKPDYAEAYFNRGNLQVESKRLEDALLDYDKAIELKPEYAEAYFNRGNLQVERKRPEDALSDYKKSIELKPDYAEVYINLGNLKSDAKRFEEALMMYDTAIELKPNFAEAYMNRGIAEIEVKRYQEAFISFDKAIAMNPTYAEAYSNRGILLLNLNYVNDALICFDKAIDIKPDYADAYFNRGTAYIKVSKTEKALESFKQALDINPELNYAFSFYLHSKMMLNNWSNIREESNTIIQLIISNKIFSNPFNIIDISSNVEVLRKVAENYSNKKHPSNYLFGTFTNRILNAKIKIAYLSADFTEHPMGYNFVGFFECLDRTIFEVIAISFIKVSDSPLTKRLVGAFDLFKTVDQMSDKEVCEWMREQNIDIAVDMMGPTTNNRQDIFAMRCAPIQINQFSWTSGAPYMDYIIADPVSIPMQFAYGYSEKLAYVPHTLFATDDKKKIAERTPSRTDENLPEHGLVLCCFNNSHKITPDVFDVWMHVMQKVPESVLWIRSAGSTMEKNLCDEAQKRGVDPKRLIFAGRVESMAEHLARYRLADLFLDTFPFCAQTTASDALWAGVPVVTCVGESSMSRICASMLHALEMPEMVTSSLQDYEQKLLELVQDPLTLTEIRGKLAHQKQVSPLFNTALYTRNIENAYLEMNKLTIN